MTYEWQPGTYYGPGSEVDYQGKRYKIIQPHTSEPGWEPPLTPALWGAMQPEYGGGYGGGPQAGFQQPPPLRDGGFSGDNGPPGYNPSYVQPPPGPGPHSPSPAGVNQPHHPQPPPGGDEKRWDEHKEQQVQIHHEERQKRWYDLDPQRKKQLEIGGGLAAGAALLGAGYYAYHNHQQKSEEEKKAAAWGLQNWIQEAQARTDAYYHGGPRGPATWVLAEGGRVPDGALQAGVQQGHPLYVCRGFFEGGLQIGKVSPHFQANGAVIGYGSKEAQLPKYEVLVGDPRALRWVEAHGHLHVSRLGARPVEGGREADGTPLYVARVQLGDSIIPGKAGEKLSAACVPVANREQTVEKYSVLCYL